MSEKTYKINDVEFIGKEKFTLDESEEIGKLLSVVVSGNDLLGNFNGNFKKFLSMVLVRKDGQRVDDNFSYGQIDEDDAAEIFKDFFFKKLKKASDIANSLSS